MSKEKPKKRWQTSAISLTEYTPGNEIKIKTDATVEVRETCRSFEMEDTKDIDENIEKAKLPYGIPISAELAVALISDLQHRLNNIKKTFDKFAEKFDGLEGFNKEDYKWLRELLVHSSGITIDKNVLLKTLSQPGCEGIRFYLCRKEIPGKEDSKLPYLSLVTVGVDANGCDLHYIYEPGKLKKGLMNAHLENTSLLSEYGTPPPPNSEGLAINYEYDKKFALLMYALEESENIIKAKQKGTEKNVNV